MMAHALTKYLCGDWCYCCICPRATATTCKVVGHHEQVQSFIKCLAHSGDIPAALTWAAGPGEGDRNQQPYGFNHALHAEMCCRLLQRWFPSARALCRFCLSNICLDKDYLGGYCLRPIYHIKATVCAGRRDGYVEITASTNRLNFSVLTGQVKVFRALFTFDPRTVWVLSWFCQSIYSVISNKNLRHWSNLQCPPPGIILE